MGKERDLFFKSQPKSLHYKPLDEVKIGDKFVGKGYPTLIIAEVGANHHGDIKNAYKLIDKACEAGADVVKFQHLTHDKIAADTVVYDEWNGKKVGALSGFFKSAEMPYEWTADLIDYANKAGIMFLSTPFDKEAVDVLDRANVAAFKVGSYEMTDDILLSYIAQKNRPIIVSTGMSTLEEVAHAVNTIIEAGNNQIILMHCVSMYPPKMEDINLRAITTLADALKLPVGFSDHSKPPFIAAPVAAVALGACVIEKHITEEQEGGSNDDPNSIKVDDFKYFVQEIRNAEQGLSGNGLKLPASNEGHKNDEIFDRWSRRSVYALRDMKAGDTVSDKDIITLRPWGGIAPKDFHLFNGLKIIRPVKARTALTPKHFKKSLE